MLDSTQINITFAPLVANVFLEGEFTTSQLNMMAVVENENERDYKGDIFEWSCSLVTIGVTNGEGGACPFCLNLDQNGRIFFS